MEMLIGQSQVPTLITSILLILMTLVTYQLLSYLQQKLQIIWLNPMLLSIVVIIPFLLHFNLSFEYYFRSTHILNDLLEPAVVALGFPLYQHLSSIKHQWKILGLLLALGVILVIVISFILTMVFIALPEIAVSLSLKSITTPIGITLTQQLNGDSSITAFAIMIAGISGALLGPSWLRFINVKSDIAIGLSIGSASHVIGSITLSRNNVHQGAYSSVALIISAVLTAFIIPLLIPLLSMFFI